MFDFCLWNTQFNQNTLVLKHTHTQRFSTSYCHFCWSELEWKSASSTVLLKSVAAGRWSPQRSASGDRNCILRSSSLCTISLLDGCYETDVTSKESLNKLRNNRLPAVPVGLDWNLMVSKATYRAAHVSIFRISVQKINLQNLRAGFLFHKYNLTKLKSCFFFRRHNFNFLLYLFSCFVSFRILMMLSVHHYQKALVWYRPTASTRANVSQDNGQFKVIYLLTPE